MILERLFLFMRETTRSSNFHRLFAYNTKTTDFIFYDHIDDSTLVLLIKKGHMDYKRIITIDPGKRSGKPCVRHMRITVTDVLEYLASGMTIDEILDDFPELTKEDIMACLAFAADRERKLYTIEQ